MKEYQENWANLAKMLGWPATETDTYGAYLVTQYQAPGRAYHNLTHLGAMFRELSTWPEPVQDRASLQLAIWFHDLVYVATRKDNEALSADEAERRLQSWGYPAEKIARVSQMIRATAGHQSVGLDEDGKLFLDLDLSILGREPAVYTAYTAAIRKEYAIYPGLLYRKGRRKVIRHFLERETLYFTQTGRQRWETQARENLRQELAGL